MKMRKILATIAAAVVACSAMVTSAFADDTTFDANLGGQFDATFNETVGEWPADATGTFTYDKETTVTWDFGTEKVKLAGNYLGIKTSAPFDTTEGAKNSEVVVSSIKADGKEVDFDASKVFIGDNDSKAGTIKITLINEWGEIKGAPAVDFNAINGTDGFSKLEITFTVKAIPAAEEKPAESTTDSTKPADDSNKPTGATAGLALAGLAIAGVAVVATKKSK